ncbi:MAG: outer membrane beta-barrel protein [Gemmatimonadetes bacterium]|nr:outer membrane beta-barrel protein [Gemmatimonadota bacterium]
MRAPRFPRFAAALLGAALLAPAGRLAAQGGIFAGIHYSGASLDLKGASKNVDFGGGYGVHAGVGLGDNLQVVVNYDKNRLPSGAGGTSAEVAQVDALARLFVLVPPGSPLRVFATGGVTGRTVKFGQEFDGLSPTGGAGVYVRPLPKVAFTGTALWTFGNLTSSTQLTNRSGNEFSSTGVRVQVGASLFLLGR